MSQLLEMATLAKNAAEAKPDNKDKWCPKCKKAPCVCKEKKAAEAEQEAQAASNIIGATHAAKLMGAGGAIVGASMGAARNVGSGPIGMATGALSGAISGGLGGALTGGLIAGGVHEGNTPSQTASNIGKRYGNVVGALGGVSGAIAGGIAGASHGVPGAIAGGIAGGALSGGLSYGFGRLGGWGEATAGQAVLGNKKEASENMYSDEEVQLAKVAAEEVYNNAMNEVVEKVAFAQALMDEANVAEQVNIKVASYQKIAQDNGPGLGVPYIDQVRTPAGAAVLGAGAGVGGVLGYMKNPSAVGAIGGGVLGAGVVAGAGALKAFVDQHRMARAQQQAQNMQQPVQ